MNFFFLSTTKVVFIFKMVVFPLLKKEKYYL